MERWFLYRKGYEILGECSSSSSNNKVRLSEEFIEALMNGELVLPYSDNFPCLQPFLVLGDVKKLIIAGKGIFKFSCGSGLPFDIHFSL